MLPPDHGEIARLQERAREKAENIAKEQERVRIQAPMMPQTGETEQPMAIEAKEDEWPEVSETRIASHLLSCTVGLLDTRIMAAIRGQCRT